MVFDWPRRMRVLARPTGSNGFNVGALKQPACQSYFGAAYKTAVLSLRRSFDAVCVNSLPVCPSLRGSGCDVRITKGAGNAFAAQANLQQFLSSPQNPQRHRLQAIQINP